jgi:hypothetical protein
MWTGLNTLACPALLADTTLGLADRPGRAGPGALEGIPAGPPGRVGPGPLEGILVGRRHDRVVVACSKRMPVVSDSDIFFLLSSRAQKGSLGFYLLL